MNFVVSHRHYSLLIRRSNEDESCEGSQVPELGVTARGWWNHTEDEALAQDGLAPILADRGRHTKNWLIIYSNSNQC